MIHTRSAGGIVLNTRGQVLVVNQRGLSWSLPKGHIEAGEDVQAAARREITEESGISELEYLGDIGSYTRQKISRDGGEDFSESKTITFFLFRTSQVDLQPTDPDNPEARWVDRNKVEALLTHPKDKAFFREWVEKLPV